MLASSFSKKVLAVSSIVVKVSSEKVFSKKNKSPFMHNSIRLIILFALPFHRIAYNQFSFVFGKYAELQLESLCSIVLAISLLQLVECYVAKSAKAEL